MREMTYNRYINITFGVKRKNKCQLFLLMMTSITTVCSTATSTSASKNSTSTSGNKKEGPNCLSLYYRDYLICKNNHGIKQKQIVQ